MWTPILCDVLLPKEENRVSPEQGGHQYSRLE